MSDQEQLLKEWKSKKIAELGQETWDRFVSFMNVFLAIDDKDFSFALRPHILISGEAHQSKSHTMFVCDNNGNETHIDYDEDMPPLEILPE